MYFYLLFFMIFFLKRYDLIKLQKHASIFIKLHNWNLMVHRANQRLYWMIHLTFGHYYWMILQKNLGMTPPYHSGRGRYTQGFNDFRKGTLNQFFSSLCVSCVHYHNRNHNPNHNNHNQKIIKFKILFIFGYDYHD